MKLALQRATVGALAFVAVSAFAAPAMAAEPADLDLSVVGTTLDIDANSKDLDITVTNLGPGVVEGWTITFDTTGLDATKVKLVLPEWCVGNVCDFTGTLAQHENVDHTSMDLARVDGAKGGDAGKLGITLSSATEDSNPVNNTKTVDVTLSEDGGVDLRALADDIINFDEKTPVPVLPGETSEFFGLAYNQGSKAANGFKASVTLPKGVTFIEAPDYEDFLEACEFTEGNSKAVCVFEDWKIEPGTVDEGEKWGFVLLPVQVAADAAGPVNLNGGVFTVEALEAAPSLLRSAATTPTLPARINTGKLSEVDASDNVDEFIAYIGKAGGEGGGEGGGSEGGLPVTGANIATIGGAGALVLLTGAAMFVLTRRKATV